ncbi:MAG: hypothetical protein A3B68_04250 [Candidatus Melainabacteria bacterium RIFCSPHIGHO2_02_FULL_34_12]|nr:MAG: hypothetical protein A3B68_04250 [Candidatus Melainabacteria bacterium RIFCSPHIGHO2_02_FULL_34_12]
MTQISKITSYIYGFLLIFGGIMGYVKAHSKMSLITGLVSGILIFLACNLGAKKPKEGYLSIAAISLVLSLFFLMRYSSTHTFMPSGLMLILSTTTFVVVGLSWFKGKK